MMQEFLLCVLLNILFDLLLTRKLILSGILSEFNLSIKELNTLTCPPPPPVYSLFLLILKIRNRLLFVIRIINSIRSTVLNYNKSVTKLDIETTIPDS